MTGETMPAVVLDRFGGHEPLRLDEAERPRPGAGEVLVRVHASGTNPVDAKVRQAAAGGVGSFAVQFATALGARVVASTPCHPCS